MSKNFNSLNQIGKRPFKADDFIVFKFTNTVSSKPKEHEAVIVNRKDIKKNKFAESVEKLGYREFYLGTPQIFKIIIEQKLWKDFFKGKEVENIVKKKVLENVSSFCDIYNEKTEISPKFEVLIFERISKSFCRHFGNHLKEKFEKAKKNYMDFNLKNEISEFASKFEFPLFDEKNLERMSEINFRLTPENLGRFLIPLLSEKNDYCYFENDKGIGFSVYIGNLIKPYYGKRYSGEKRAEAMEKLISLIYKEQPDYYRTEHYDSFSYTELKQVIYSLKLELLEKANEVKYEIERVKEKDSEYARTYEEKKNINETTKKHMRNTSFLDIGFKYVEFDNNVRFSDNSEKGMESNMEKFEKEILKLKPLFKKYPVNSLDLRFRKLGNRKANGIFFPTKNCIAIDINETEAINSFFHEYGHFIDYNNETGKTFSGSTSFARLRNEYRKVFNSELLKNNIVLQERKQEYYKSATEIFARAFEYYCANVGLETNFNKNLNEMSELGIKNGYIFDRIDREVMNEITDFFEERLNYREEIKKIIRNLKVNTDKKNRCKNEKEETMTNHKQLSLF